MKKKNQEDLHLERINELLRENLELREKMHKLEQEKDSLQEKLNTANNCLRHAEKRAIKYGKEIKKLFTSALQKNYDYLETDLWINQEFLDADL